MKRRRSTRVSLLIFGSLFTGIALLTPTRSVAATDNSSASAKELRLRSEFGLSTSPLAIREAHARADSRANFLKIPLTLSESLDIAKRGEVAYDLGKLTDRIAKVPTYGGISIDQRVGGVVHEYYVGTSQSFDADISKVVRSRARIVRAPVTRSYSELQAQFDGLDPNDSRLTSAGIKVVSVDLNVDINGLRVGIMNEPSVAQLHILEQTAPGGAVFVIGDNVSSAASRYSTGSPNMRGHVSP